MGYKRNIFRDIIYVYKGKETKYVYYVTTEGEYKERISLNQVGELFRRKWVSKDRTCVPSEC